MTISVELPRPSKWFSKPPPSSIVAIPAKNEAERIGSCLAALAMQRDSCGAPLPPETFEILVFANDCEDATVDVALAMAELSPQPIVVLSETLPSDKANAGWARKRAMDRAADRLRETRRRPAMILTTDADSCASPTWFAETARAMAAGADCVAGYVDAHPAELMSLGAAFLRRARLEDEYIRAVAEIYAVCDPRPHDPWPNHRVSSGASLAVTLDAYLAIGGLPPRALGEDIALTQALECAGFKVRHSMSVQAYTSCRFDGRAKGGAADAMRLRHALADAPCDADLEPALFAARRALCKGALRRLSELGMLDRRDLRPRLRLSDVDEDAFFQEGNDSPFEEFWTRLVAACPALSRRVTLRPSGLPRQIARANAILPSLRALDCPPRQFADAIAALARIRARAAKSNLGEATLAAAARLMPSTFDP